MVTTPVATLAVRVSDTDHVRGPAHAPVRGAPALFLDDRPYEGPVELSALRRAIRRATGVRAAAES